MLTDPSEEVISCNSLAGSASASAKSIASNSLSVTNMGSRSTDPSPADCGDKDSTVLFSKSSCSSSVGFALPPADMPSISICTSSRASCTLEERVFPVGTKAIWAAVWSFCPLSRDDKSTVAGVPFSISIRNILPLSKAPLRFWSSVPPERTGLRSIELPPVILTTAPSRPSSCTSPSVPPFICPAMAEAKLASSVCNALSS